MIPKPPSSTKNLPAFNPSVHPDILFRGLLMGIPKKMIAELVGVPLHVLDEWVATIPEMREQDIRAAGADAEVAVALFYSATGFDPHNQRPCKPSITAQIFWLKARLGWQEKSVAVDDDKVPKNMEDIGVGTLSKMLEELSTKIEKAKPIDATPVIERISGTLDEPQEITEDPDVGF